MKTKSYLKLTWLFCVGTFYILVAGFFFFFEILNDYLHKESKQLSENFVKKWDVITTKMEQILDREWPDWKKDYYNEE